MSVAGQTQPILDSAPGKPAVATLAGLALVLTFDVLQGTNAVFLSSFLQQVDVSVVLFCTFLTIALVFLSRLLLLGGMAARRFSGQEWKLLLLLNVTTAVSWSTFFIAVKYIEPALSSTFVNAVFPLATLAVDYCVNGKRNLRPAELAVAGALFLSTLATGAVVLGGASGRPTGSFDAYAVGLAMSAVCGIAMSGTNLTSKRLNLGGVSAADIMAFRFLLLVVVSAVMCDKSSLASDLIDYWPQILFVVFLGNLIPIFALQLGVERLRPITVAFLIGLAPIIVFMLQGFSSAISFSWPSLLVTAITTCFILAGVRVSIRSTAAARKESRMGGPE